LLIAESNEDNDLLAADTKRPGFVKARIRRRYGYLPNEAAPNLIKDNKANRWKEVILTHVSLDHNNETSIRKLLATAKELKFDVDIAPHRKTLQKISKV
jgi:phosphoribosyl 1,2-cyclic phosphodiesterase